MGAKMPTPPPDGPRPPPPKPARYWAIGRDGKGYSGHINAKPPYTIRVADDGGFEIVQRDDTGGGR